MFKKTILAIAILLTVSATANAQGYNNNRQQYNNNRPSWGGYYNGYGVVPGYRYNQQSGWNTITTPNGNWIHYRDGYIPMNRRRYYYPNYYGGSYADIISQFVW